MLFGHQNDKKPVQTTDNVVAPGVNPLAVDPDTGVSLPTVPDELASAGDSDDSPSSILNQPASGSDFGSLSIPAPMPDPAPAAPTATPTVPDDDLDDAPTPEPATESEEPIEINTDNPVVEDTDDTSVKPEELNLSTLQAAEPSTDTDDLLQLKQEAIEQLSPLVDQLDQTPEEKFRTTMMMIQSTDNRALVKEAYEAAQAITDDKVRAQALLDIVNEINYFTQK